MRLLLLAALLLSPGAALAAGGLTGAPTLRKPLGSRALAMGEAFAAAEGGLDSLGYNPAGLATQQKRELHLAHLRGVIDDKFSYAAYAQPLGRLRLAAGLAYYDAGTLHLNLTNGVQERRKLQQDFMGLFGAALPLAGGFSAGGVLRAYRLELAGAARASGASADVGAQWRAPFLDGLSFGGALQHLGPDVKFEQEGDPLPRTVRAGAAYALDAAPPTTSAVYALRRVLVTADMIHVREEAASAVAGLELDFIFAHPEHVILRVGHAFASPADGLAVGAGFREKRFRLDYGAGFKRALTSQHHITVGFSF